MESLANTASKKVVNIQSENFHEFLRGYTDIFSKNILNSKDFTYKNLSVMQDKNIVILQGDKDSSVIIIDKSDYIQKLEDMIEKGIIKGTYERTDALLYKFSKDFKIFFTETFTIMKTTTRCILPVTNQPNYMELLILKILRK